MKITSLFLICISPLLMYSQEPNKAYSTFDFVPGDKIVYFNNFERDTKGELPAGWNTTGSAEVITMNNSNWVKLLQNATFITDNTQSFSENYTVEFDLFLDFKFNNAFFPAFSFGILNTGSAKPNSNAVLQNMFLHHLLSVDVNTGLEQNSITKLVSFSNESEYFNSGEKSFKPLENMLQQNIHVSMQVQKERFRLWLNEHKLFDVPQAIPAAATMNQLFFRVSESSYTNDQIGIYVSNLKVAKGIADTRSRLITDGKFSTTGILFDVNAAVIRPASYGIIKEIADVLKANPSVKILITGHTDADGNEADNLQLSKKRSEAVKQMLISEYGIPAANLSCEGKGETQPVADNNTKEGKAQNRRVEFIKQ